MLQAVAVGKTSTAEHVAQVCAMLTDLERKLDVPEKSVKLIPAIETCLGVINAHAICSADSARVIAVAFGADDCTFLMWVWWYCGVVVVQW